MAGSYSTRFDAETGITFVFKYDTADPDLLHIFVRHATSTEEAIRTFREGKAGWNERFRRFESHTDTHGLHRFWVVPGRVVMVISCFRKEGPTWTSR